MSHIAGPGGFFAVGVITAVCCVCMVYSDTRRKRTFKAFRASLVGAVMMTAPYWLVIWFTGGLGKVLKEISKWF